MPDRYDWVFLDVGETLVKVGRPDAAFRQILATLGYPLELETLAEMVQRVREETLTLEHLGPGPEYRVDAARAHARRERFVDAILREIGVAGADLKRCRAGLWEAFSGGGYFSLYPEVVETLGGLQAAGYRLGIISNWDPRLELLCRNLDLARWFEFILASEAEGFAKPGPRLFERALELAEVRPERAVHVGDSYEHDVRGATALGISAVLLDRFGSYAPEIWRPVIGSLAELPGLLTGGTQ
jgi:HAD superfamily hydrolase (TIGR01549 family)